MTFNLSEAQKIVVTGGNGFLGRHVIERLISYGAEANRIVVPRSSKCDLRSFENALSVTKDADLVVHLAAKVGGIGFNRKFPGQLFYDNAIMGINLIEASRQNNVKKILVAGTICAYPRFTPVPFQEENLWNGYPEETNAPYGIAKKSLAVMLAAYREEYGLNGIFVLPVNLYGPWDNFHLEHAHVIPALIRKFLEAKQSNSSSVELWGDGSPTREFLYVDDAAKAICLAATRFESSEPVNLGSSEEISIKSLAEVVKSKIGFEGEIIWNSSYPNGQERRKLDTHKAEKYFGFKSEVSLDQGLDRTINWWKAASQRN